MPGYSAKEVAELKAFLKKKREKREHELARRKAAALAAARRAAEVIHRYGLRPVWLFGSLAGEGTFGEHSDIDLAIDKLPPQIDFWRLYSEVLAAAQPFNVDLVVLDAATPELKENVYRTATTL
ncbi:MAG: nucleotidyltransferase family protein [Moorellaceae bacterium]